MKLSVKGFSRRLNGPSTPIEEFEREYGLDELQGEIALPLPECYFTYCEGGRISFRFDQEVSDLSVAINNPVTVMKERGILGVSIRFELKE